MKQTTQKWWTLAAVVGLAYWFFGNLYEAVVFSPNWVVDTSAQMQRLREFFVNTSPTWYFMPLTALDMLLVWSLWASNRRDIVRRDYRRAGLFAALATCVNALTVAVVMKLFAPEYMAHAAALSTYCQYWNALNLARMLLVATTAVFLFNAFRKLDRAGDEDGRTALSTAAVPATNAPAA